MKKSLRIGIIYCLILLATFALPAKNSRAEYSPQERREELLKESEKKRNISETLDLIEQRAREGKPAQEAAEARGLKKVETGLTKEEEEKQKLEEIKELYEEGKSYLRRGLYSEASACFEKVIVLESSLRAKQEERLRLKSKAEKKQRESPLLSKEQRRKAFQKKLPRIKAEKKAERQRLKREAKAKRREEKHLKKERKRKARQFEELAKSKVRAKKQRLKRKARQFEELAKSKVRAKKQRLKREAEAEGREEKRLGRREERGDEEKALEQAQAELAKRTKEPSREALFQQGTLFKEKASDYIIIKKWKALREVLEDAAHLCSIGKYENVLPLYNYALDISKEKSLTKKILAAKKKVKSILGLQEKEEEKLRKEIEKAEKQRLKREAKAKRREEKHLKKERKRKIKALYKQALSYYSQDELARAEEVFKQILALNPEEKKSRTFIDKKIPARQRRLERIRQKEAERKK